MKKCSKCGILQDLGQFFKAGDTLDGKGSWCRGCHRESNRAKYGLLTSEQKTQRQVLSKRWRDANRDRSNFLKKRSYEKIRLETLKQYCKGEEPSCACCGEKEIKFLSFDHINGGGLKHLKEIGRGNLMLWLRKNNYPSGFQVLCHNCNFAKGHYQQCPHNKVKT